MPFLLYSFIR